MRPDKRLHPAGIAVYSLAVLRRAWLPVATVLVFAGIGRGFDEGSLLRTLGFTLASFAIAITAGYLRWRMTIWWVSEDGSIHHRGGLISIRETTVPLTRVQSLDVELGPMQRFFGIQKLHVQTAGGKAKGEIVLDAVDSETVGELRALIAGRGLETAIPVGRPETLEEGQAPAVGVKPAGEPEGVDAPTAPPAPEAEPVVRRLTGTDLVLAALTASQLSVLIPVCVFILNLGENFAGTDEGQSALGLAPHSLGGWLLVAATLLLLAWLALVVATIVAFGGFTVSRDGDRLRIKRGFIVHRETTIPIGRVRAVEIVEGVLRRPFGFVTVRIEVIGHAKEHATARIFFPLLRRADVKPFFGALLPELADDPNGLEPPPGRALRRYVLPPALAGLLAGVLFWQFADIGAWVVLVAIPAALYGAARHRVAGWRLADGRLVVRSLRLARTTVLAPVRNNEGYGLAQTPFQRRADLASLEVRFGKKTTARISHLDAGAAADAFGAIGASALPRRG